MLLFDSLLCDDPIKSAKTGLLGGWMDGRMDGRMGGGRMDGRMGRSEDAWEDRRMGGRTGGWVVGEWMDVQHYPQTFYESREERDSLPNLEQIKEESLVVGRYNIQDC